MTELPPEILLAVFAHLSKNDLISVSLTNWKHRYLSLPYLFHTLKVKSSLSGLNRLQNVSKSYVSTYVKILCYEASELIDPNIQRLDYFKSCIYTSSEFVRDQNDSFWGRGGERVTYNSIYSYFNCLAKEQQRILDTREDLKAFRRSIPRFASLHSVHITYVAGVHKSYLWFAPRVFADWNYSFIIHLETIIDAMVVAKENDILVRCFQISGFYAHPRACVGSLRHKMADGLSNIETLCLDDSPNLIDFMSKVHLPVLRHFELGRCWVTYEDIQSVLNAHLQVRSVQLSKIWLPERLRLELSSLGEIQGEYRDNRVEGNITINVDR
ncbi:unnamed protein product [Penicillium egyptiacum]|uniref:F-box domain-containing protein n=1 Tax=Penicillium egyptiacum TaxID=1303716 RepID=A0A9W4KF61_9EURO|nr:unnamed protein product [Penicillium egyptiacum]